MIYRHLNQNLLVNSIFIKLVAIYYEQVVGSGVIQGKEVTFSVSQSKWEKIVLVDCTNCHRESLIK